MKTAATTTEKTYPVDKHFSAKVFSSDFNRLNIFEYFQFVRYFCFIFTRSQFRTLSLFLYLFLSVRLSPFLFLSRSPTHSLYLLLTLCVQWVWVCVCTWMRACARDKPQLQSAKATDETKILPQTLHFHICRQMNNFSARVNKDGWILS